MVLNECGRCGELGRGELYPSPWDRFGVKWLCARCVEDVTGRDEALFRMRVERRR